MNTSSNSVVILTWASCKNTETQYAVSKMSYLMIISKFTWNQDVINNAASRITSYRVILTNGMIIVVWKKVSNRFGLIIAVNSSFLSWTHNKSRDAVCTSKPIGWIQILIQNAVQRTKKFLIMSFVVHRVFIRRNVVLLYLTRKSVVIMMNIRTEKNVRKIYHHWYSHLLNSVNISHCSVDLIFG